MSDSLEILLRLDVDMQIWSTDDGLERFSAASFDGTDLLRFLTAFFNAVTSMISNGSETIK